MIAKRAAIARRRLPYVAAATAALFLTNGGCAAAPAPAPGSATPVSEQPPAGSLNSANADSDAPAPDAAAPALASTAVAADEDTKDSRPKRCIEAKDYDGGGVCKDPPGYDSGFVALPHPCPKAVVLPGAAAVPVRYIAMGGPMGLIHDSAGGCQFPPGRVRTATQAAALKAKVGAKCWNVSLDALSRLDYGKFEALIVQRTDHDGSVILFEDASTLHEVVSDRACRGTAPMRYTSIEVRRKTDKTVKRQQCPRVPCMAP